MSSIQNADVKGTPQLDNLGLPYSHLIHDTKIWISAEGINRTLYEAIVDKAIGLKGTAGAQIKNLSIITDDTPNQVGSPVAAEFDGTNTLLNSADEFTFQSDFTICGWFYLDNKASDMVLFSKWGLVGDQIYELRYDQTADKFDFRVNRNDNVEETVVGSVTPSAATWHFVAMRFENGVGVEIRVDNSAWVSTAFALNLRNSTVAPLRIGGDLSGSGGLDGRIDSLGFYDAKLSDVQVDEIYNAGAGRAYEILPVDHKENLVARLDLDETSGDRSTKGSTKTYAFTDVGSVASNTGHIAPYVDNNLEVYGAFVDVDGNTVVSVPWQIRPDSLMFVNVGLKQWMEHVSDPITPDCWFKKEIGVDSFRIRIYGDRIADLANEPIVISNLKGVPPPSAAVSIVEGLQPLNEACGNTTNISGSSGVADVSVVGGKTQIEFNFDIDPKNLLMLYVENKLWPKQNVIGLPADKYYKLVGDRTIELDQDYSVQNWNFYVAYFAEESIVDENGNFCIQMVPYFRSFGLVAPNLATWALGINDFGELVANDQYDIIPEDIRFRRDDNTICQLVIDNNGVVTVDDSPVGVGLLFDEMFFLSPNGTIWKLGIDNLNSIYVTDEAGQKFCVQNKAGQTLYQIQKFAEGAGMSFKYYEEGVTPPDGDPTSDETAFCFIEKNGRIILHAWDSSSEEWVVFTGWDAPVGEVKDSILSTEQIQEQLGTGWLPLDGSVLEVINYPELAAKRPDWVNGDDIELPNSQVMFWGVHFRALAEFASPPFTYKGSTPYPLAQRFLRHAYGFAPEDQYAGISVPSGIFIPISPGGHGGSAPGVWFNALYWGRIPAAVEDGRYNGGTYANAGPENPDPDTYGPSVFGFTVHWTNNNDYVPDAIYFYRNNRKINRYIKAR